MKRIIIILALLSLTACASLPLEHEWLDQLAKESQDKAEIVTAASAVAVLRMPAWTIGERALTCQIPKGIEREDYKRRVSDQIFRWHIETIQKAGLSVALDAVSVAHPESMDAWSRLIEAVVEAEIESGEKYQLFECGR